MSKLRTECVPPSTDSNSKTQVVKLAQRSNLNVQWACNISQKKEKKNQKMVLLEKKYGSGHDLCKAEILVSGPVISESLELI